MSASSTESPIFFASAPGRCGHATRGRTSVSVLQRFVYTTVRGGLTVDPVSDLLPDLIPPMGTCNVRLVVILRLGTVREMKFVGH